MIGSIIAADFALARAACRLQSGGRFHVTARAGAPGFDRAWPGASGCNPEDRMPGAGDFDGQALRQ